MLGDCSSEGQGPRGQQDSSGRREGGGNEGGATGGRGGERAAEHAPHWPERTFHVRTVIYSYLDCTTLRSSSRSVRNHSTQVVIGITSSAVSILEEDNLPFHGDFFFRRAALYGTVGVRVCSNSSVPLKSKRSSLNVAGRHMLAGSSPVLSLQFRLCYASSTCHILYITYCVCGIT